MPRIAVGPVPADWAAEAIRRGGGQPVTLDQDPVGLVWTDGDAMQALRDTLAARPGIGWVQLPQAGVERRSPPGSSIRGGGGPRPRARSPSRSPSTRWP